MKLFDWFKRRQLRLQAIETALSKGLQLFDHGPGERDAAYEMQPDPHEADRILVFKPESMEAVYPKFPTAPDYVITVKRSARTGELGFECSCQWYRQEQKRAPGEGWCKHTEGLTMLLARATPLVEMMQRAEIAAISQLDTPAMAPVYPTESGEHRNCNCYSTAPNLPEAERARRRLS